MRSRLGQPSWREQYLAQLRFHLRGYSPALVEDYVAQIEAQIDDDIDAEIQIRLKHHPVFAENWLALLAVDRGRADAFLASHIDGFKRYSHEYTLVERNVVARLMPPEKLAAEFRAAITRRTVRDRDSLMIDLSTMGFSIALLLATGSDAISTFGHIGGAVGVAVATMSALVRRLPLSKWTALVRALLPPVRYATVGTAVITGSAGVVGLALDIMLAHNSNGWVFSAHISHIPMQIAALVCALLFGLQPRSIGRYERLLTRSFELDLYREDRYGYIRQSAVDQAHDTNYFTEKDW